MNDLILSDLYRYEGTSARKLTTKLKYVLFTPGFQFTYFFRKASLARNPLSKAFWKVCHRLSMWHYGFQIPVGTQIGPGFRISHFGDMGINREAVIGKNFNIAPGAHISYADGKRKGVPIIGDNVILNINSVIVGGVRIGNNVLIAPCTFVNFDVPDNSIVIGSPGKIIQRESSPTDKYIVYPVE